MTLLAMSVQFSSVASLCTCLNDGRGNPSNSWSFPSSHDDNRVWPTCKPHGDCSIHCTERHWQCHRAHEWFPRQFGDRSTFINTSWSAAIAY